jgi:hypothetical protein
MTETREIGRDEYREISRKASNLLGRINGLMDQLHGPGPRLPAEWHDLHNLMSLAGIISDFAARYAEQAPDPDAPVPYTVAGDMGPCAGCGRPVMASMRYVESDLGSVRHAGCASPAHAIYSTAPGPDVPF